MIRQVFKILTLICIISCPLEELAQGAPAPAGKNFWALDLGAHATNLEQRFSAPSGYSGKVGSLVGFLRLRRGYSLGKNFYFEPSYAVLLPWRTSADGTTKTFTSQLDLDLGVPLFKFLKFRVGPGLQWLFILPSGQSVDLDNGTSTSTFFTPSKVANSFVATVQSGFEIRFSRKISLNLDVFFLDIASRDRRHYNAAASLGVTL